MSYVIILLILIVVLMFKFKVKDKNKIKNNGFYKGNYIWYSRRNY